MQDDPPEDGPDELDDMLSDMLDNAPTTPDNMYGTED